MFKRALKRIKDYSYEGGRIRSNSQSNLTTQKTLSRTLLNTVIAYKYGTDEER
jgi:hypothetical protein